jgi:hypothetical protein
VSAWRGALRPGAQQPEIELEWLRLAMVIDVKSAFAA